MATVDSIDKGKLLADFGQSYGIGLILAHPELKLLAYQSQGWTNAKLDKQGNIIPGKNTGKEWDSSRTAAAIQQTGWYNSKDGNLREAENAKLTDPTSYNGRIDDLIKNIEQKATAAGADLSGQDVAGFAEKVLSENWNYMSGSADAQAPERILNGFLAPLLKKDTDTGAFKGEAAVNAATLRQQAQKYGVDLSDQWYLKAVQGMKDGSITQADLTTEIINNSKSRYQGLANQITDARSVADLADPYVQLYARTMEQNPAEITINHPDIQKALQVVDPSTGSVRMKSLWEFQQELRQKPEWGNTTQGRQELNAGAMKMLKDFGFVE